jgi:adenylate kinase family enzyme
VSLKQRGGLRYADARSSLAITSTKRAKLLGALGILCAMNDASRMIGHRVLVDGMMGSGKSTFARALAARTGLPVIHLDLHYWKPGWVRPSDDEWRERQRALLAGEAWIIDGNYNETLALRLERAETVVFLDTPWWLCASRAFVRGLRKPVGEMPEGCEDSVNRRLRDEWGGVARIWRNRRSEPEYARSKILRQGSHTTVNVLRSRREARAFLDDVCR